ncbi:NAD-dependent epimerase/dehydratase family protein [Saccharothrix longispora]|uniref:NAD-dependent epimerase/dehydratase family protein n=1 Tax=Saccharothrix longispora TaxID=33920 RepID=UPI0028FD1954|nr:NAD-dependent epimerase/dehydratase family protein [Saccharothrix longispora]MBY8849392.1 NAD-dependent epimerase/dehydratase family protein [Saccharothrix sp. MB29]MDU0288890.1 NAD-dependent epimerase/dehydratase family protein [Saccharothrix longispora]
MRIVITGASGNVGTGVLRALAAEGGHEVVGLCRRPPDPVPPYDGVVWHRCDLADSRSRAVLDEVLPGADAVVHAVWAFQPLRDAGLLHRTNYAGTLGVFDAARRAGVPHVVHTSSIAVYGPAGEEPVDERWPATGVPGSVYGQGKAEVEAELRRFAAENPQMAVAVLRPTLVAQRDASESFRALFFDPLVPRWLIRLVERGALPVLPLPAGLRVRFVHADDVGDAVVRVLRTRASGAFNLAAGPTVTADDLATLVGARALPVPPSLVRAAVGALWRLRLLRASPGWFDVGMRSPVVDSTRALDELGWEPRVSGTDAAREQLRGLADGAEGGSPVLRRDRLRGMGGQRLS